MTYYNIDILSRLTSAASTEKTRYYLCGVNVSALGTGTLYTATDGKILACEIDANTPYAGEPVIVSLAAIEDMKRVLKNHMKANKHGAVILHATIAGNTFVLCERPDPDTGNALAVSTPQTFTEKSPFIDGAFPDFKRVLPKFDSDIVPGSADSFNSSCLALLLASAPGSSKNRATAIFNIYQNKLEDPALICVSRSNTWFGIIMPVPKAARVPKYIPELYYAVLVSIGSKK
jgi:DNA polymerase III sliding clamp (beta) subunit (PCNA family)